MPRAHHALSPTRSHLQRARYLSPCSSHAAAMQRQKRPIHRQSSTLPHDFDQHVKLPPTPPLVLTPSCFVRPSEIQESMEPFEETKTSKSGRVSILRTNPTTVKTLFLQSAPAILSRKRVHFLSYRFSPRGYSETNRTQTWATESDGAKVEFALRWVVIHVAVHPSLASSPTPARCAYHHSMRHQYDVTRPSKSITW